jgi:hypothetical protein
MFNLCSVLLLIILFVLLSHLNYLEGFEGKYPQSVENPLLHNWYPSYKPEPQWSTIPQFEQYKNYPAFPAKSMNINNIRQWRQPNNGQCSPNGVCGNFYSDREVVIPPPVKCPGFKENESRVNFYYSQI